MISDNPSATLPLPGPPEIVLSLVVIRQQQGEKASYVTFLKCSGNGTSEDLYALKQAGHTCAEAHKAKMGGIVVVPAGAMPKQ